MKTLQAARTVVAILATGLIFSLALQAHGQRLGVVQSAPTQNVLEGTFYLNSLDGSSPPFPFDPYNGALPITTLDATNHIYLVLDTPEDYAALQAQHAAETAMNSQFNSLNSTPLYSSPTNDGTNLWLELHDITNNFMDFFLYNTTNCFTFYQIVATTNLTDRLWIPITTPTYGDCSTNQLYFPSVPNEWYWSEGNLLYWTNSQMFFLACESPYLICIYPFGPVSVNRPSSTNDLSQNVTNYFLEENNPSPGPRDVTCSVFGSAVYGLDYIILGADYNYSNSTVTITIPPVSSESGPFVVCPLYNTNAIFDNMPLFVTMSLGLGPYLFDSSYYTKTIDISDLIPVLFTTNVPSSSAPVGIDYQPIENTLVLSVNSPSGLPNNFMLIGTNEGGVLTFSNWSDVAGVPGEVEIATVKTTANGFNQGEMYFGNNQGGIDKLSADGSQWTTNWCVLTNPPLVFGYTVTGIYIDSSGTFDGNLIVATTAEGVGTMVGCVWRIGITNGNVQPMLLTNFPIVAQLAGAISVTNDVAKWGPWAGKILTGDQDESVSNPNAPVIYAIDTNGIVTTFDTSFAGPAGINVEYLALISPDQDLYFIDALNGQLMKISREALAPYVGDLLITANRANEGLADSNLYIVAWDSAHSIFESRVIPAPGRVVEDAAFAPLNLPSQ